MMMMNQRHGILTNLMVAIMPVSVLMIRGAIVGESLTSNDDDDDDDDDDFVFINNSKDDDDDDDVIFIDNNNKPRQPFGRYHAMLKREEERRLDMEFFDMYLVNRKKEEECRSRILGDANHFNQKDMNNDDDDRDDTFIAVDLCDLAVRYNGF
jgi:hypothetical protein